MPIHIVGLDTAKSVFQAHGVNRTGTVVLRKRLPGGGANDRLAGSFMAPNRNLAASL